MGKVFSLEGLGAKTPYIYIQYVVLFSYDNGLLLAFSHLDTQKEKSTEVCKETVSNMLVGLLDTYIH